MDLEDWPRGKVKRSNSTFWSWQDKFFIETSSRISPSNLQQSNGVSQMKPQRKEEPEILTQSFKLHVARFFALDI